MAVLHTYLPLVASPVFLLGIAVLLFLYLWKQAYVRHGNFPPGPPRLPIWGSYWLFLWEDYNYLHKSLLAAAKRYKTKIMGFYLGVYPCILLTDYDDIKEMQSRPEFAGRTDVIVVRERSHGERHGILFNDGPEWMDLRRFFLRHIRDFGWGRRFETTEGVMLEELQDMMELLRGEWKDEDVVRGSRVQVTHLLTPFAVNVVWSMFGGERAPRHQHPEVRHFCAEILRFFRMTDASGNAVSLTPWLRFLSPRRFGLQDVADFNGPVQEFVRKSILRHKESASDGDSQNFIDKYLSELKNIGGEGISKVFSEHQLLMLGVDLLSATAGALSSTSAFICQLLLHNPDVQKKVQQEIDEVMGRDRQPVLDDRQNMPYTEATIRECMRRVTLAPLSVPHCSLEDTTFKGYDIPKGTVIFAHLDSFHMDPEIWGDPENFRPERFLESDGSLKKHDCSFPFGGGKRLCVGETLSRHFLFLFVTHLLQSFTLLPTENLPAMDAAYGGFARIPLDIWAHIEPRY